MQPSLPHPSAHVWHPYTRHSAVAAGLPCIVRGEGIHLFDDQGRRYVDAISSWWACALGHGHPRVVAAIRDQAERLQHSILGNLSHPPALELAARLASLMPTPDRHVHFASDGASAIEAALKIALQYEHQRGRPEKIHFLSLREAYHGDTLAAVGLGFLEAFHRPFRGVAHPARQLPVPPYDGSEAECRAAAERLIAECAPDCAALVVEPLCQGSGGMRIYSADYLRHLADCCRAHGLLLVADEIATGFGRTGTWFAFQQAGMDPDIVCVGKALSAGYLPISAAIVKDSIYECFADTPQDHTFFHGHTFAGNPLAAAAANAAIAVYEAMPLESAVRRLAAVLAEGLAPLRDHPSVRGVRCLGLIGAVELHPGASGGPSPARRTQEAMRDRGYLIRPLGNVVYLMMPLVSAEQDLRDACDALAQSLP